MNSTLIKQEYFKLIKKLNQCNKLKNQETEVYFYLDSTESESLKLFAAISDTQRILLCNKIGRESWDVAGFSGLVNLEDFIAHLLQTVSTQNDLTNQIKSHIFKLMG